MALAYAAFVGYAKTKVPGIMPPRTMGGLQLVGLALAVIMAFAPMPIVLEPRCRCSRAAHDPGRARARLLRPGLDAAACRAFGSRR